MVVNDGTGGARDQEQAVVRRAMAGRAAATSPLYRWSTGPLTFANRDEAGKRLAEALLPLGKEDPTVLALPRGGVPVGAAIAESLGASFDVLLVRKIGVPFAPEVAMGAILLQSEPVIVRNEEIIRRAGIADVTFDRVKEKELKELIRRDRVYHGGETPVDVVGKTVILVDDGIATGSTMLAALKGLKQMAPRKIVVAVPVAPAEIAPAIRKLADQFICLEDFGAVPAVGAHYADFPQLSDSEVVSLLEKFRRTPRP
ncbi:phosphoribosyltransferase [Martelella sp. AMO21009]